MKRRFHIKYGKHSGIPSCCIMAWVNDESPPAFTVPEACYRPCHRCAARIRRGLHPPAIVRQCSDYWMQTSPFIAHCPCQGTADFDRLVAAVSNQPEVR